MKDKNETTSPQIAFNYESPIKVWLISNFQMSSEVKYTVDEPKNISNVKINAKNEEMETEVDHYCNLIVQN